MLIFLSILFLLIWSIVGVCILKHLSNTKPFPTNTLQFLAVFIACGPVAWVLLIICLVIDIATKGQYLE
jgi:uncharacterized membrane protein